MKNYLIFCVLASLFAACEGYTEGNGIVVDADTLEPLDSVFVGSWVDKIDKSHFKSEMFTDSTGTWWTSTGLVGCGLSKCADLVVRFTRQGYDTLRLENPMDSIVFLKKQ